MIRRREGDIWSIVEIHYLYPKVFFFFQDARIWQKLGSIYIIRFDYLKGVPLQ